jgi:hypothetical protein
MSCVFYHCAAAAAGQITFNMDQLSSSGQNLGRVFNFRYGRMCTTCTSYITTKLSNLKWKTWPKQLLGSLPLAFALPTFNVELNKSKPVIRELL